MWPWLLNNLLSPFLMRSHVKNKFIWYSNAGVDAKIVERRTRNVWDMGLQLIKGELNWFLHKRKFEPGHVISNNVAFRQV